MELTVLSLVFNGLLSVALYFMKASSDRTQSDITALKVRLEALQKEAHMKEDFNDFKRELWAKLDKLEQKIS